MEYLDKVELKKEYIAKFKKIYKDIPKEFKAKADDLIDTLASTRVYIDECNEHLFREGVVVQMQQGDYFIDRENPYSKQHSDKQKLYSQIIKQLDDMLPNEKEATVSKAGESLAKFVATGKKIELR